MRIDVGLQTGKHVIGNNTDSRVLTAGPRHCHAQRTTLRQVDRSHAADSLFGKNIPSSAAGNRFGELGGSYNSTATEIISSQRTTSNTEETPTEAPCYRTAADRSEE